jgi:cell filamentation protein
VTDDPYLIGDTNVLRNLLGHTRQNEFERDLDTFTRLRQVELNYHPIVGRYDFAHLCAFHKRLFGDMFDWAGQIRTVNITKGNTPFAYAHAIIPAATDLFNQLALENHLGDLDHTQFVGRAAHYLSEINALHPFREGNGRTQRAFLSQLAHDAGWQIDWAAITPEQNITASIAGFHGDETAFVELLANITAPLPAADARDTNRPLRAVPAPSPSPRRRPAHCLDASSQQAAGYTFCEVPIMTNQPNLDRDQRIEAVRQARASSRLSGGPAPTAEQEELDTRFIDGAIDEAEYLQLGLKLARQHLT